MDTTDTYYNMCYEAFPEDRDWGTVLKTQDQLQEMVELPSWNKTPQALALAFGKFCFPTIVITDEAMSAYRESQDEKRKKEYRDRLWVGKKHQEYVKQFTSMGQLWLAFYMAEKHNKVWNGENWVKEKGG